MKTIAKSIVITIFLLLAPSKAQALYHEVSVKLGLNGLIDTQHISEFNGIGGAMTFEGKHRTNCLSWEGSAGFGAKTNDSRGYFIIEAGVGCRLYIRNKITLSLNVGISLIPMFDPAISSVGTLSHIIFFGGKSTGNLGFLLMRLPAKIELWLGLDITYRIGITHITYAGTNPTDRTTFSLFSAALNLVLVVPAGLK